LNFSWLTIAVVSSDFGAGCADGKIRLCFGLIYGTNFDRPAATQEKTAVPGGYLVSYHGGGVGDNRGGGEFGDWIPHSHSPSTPCES